MAELKDKVKDLEQKVANLFMESVALTTKLKASREVERQQQEENTSLEGLVQALKAQVSMHFWSMPALYYGSLLSSFPCVQQDTVTQEQLLSKTRESQLEEKGKVLEKTQSDLEVEVMKLEKLMKQLEIFSSDIELLTKVHFHIAALLVYVWSHSLVCEFFCVSHGVYASKR